MALSLTRPVSGLFYRLASIRDRVGIAGTLHKSIDIVLQKVLHTHVHAVVWLDVRELSELSAPDPQFTFRFLTADAIEAYAKDPSYFIDPALIAGVRKGRELCFAAVAGDRLAAFGCYTVGYVKPEQAAGAAMSFPADVVYMSYGFTHPDFRGARLHGLVMGLALKELANFGITKLVSIVARSNYASLKSCYRLGYRNLGNMITVGGCKRAVGMYPKAAKQLGVRFGRKARRTVSA
jgi:hypothetical protein